PSGSDVRHSGHRQGASHARQRGGRYRDHPGPCHARAHRRAMEVDSTYALLHPRSGTRSTPERATPRTSPDMSPTSLILRRLRHPALLGGLLAAALAFTSPAGHAADERKPAAAAAGKSLPPSARLDINSATEAELTQLRGIGEARARAIIAGRPYSGRDDLVKRKIIPQGVYDEIKDQIIARQK